MSVVDGAHDVHRVRATRLASVIVAWLRSDPNKRTVTSLKLEEAVVLDSQSDRKKSHLPSVRF